MSTKSTKTTENVADDNKYLNEEGIKVIGKKVGPNPNGCAITVYSTGVATGAAKPLQNVFPTSNYFRLGCKSTKKILW